MRKYFKELKMNSVQIGKIKEKEKPLDKVASQTGMSTVAKKKKKKLAVKSK